MFYGGKKPNKCTFERKYPSHSRGTYKKTADLNKNLLKIRK